MTLLKKGATKNTMSISEFFGNRYIHDIKVYLWGFFLSFDELLESSIKHLKLNLSTAFSRFKENGY